MASWNEREIASDGIRTMEKNIVDIPSSSRTTPAEQTEKTNS